METTAIFGLLLGIGGILLGNVIEGGHVGSLVQGAAAVIVFTGTFGAVLLSSKKRDVKLGLQMLKKAFAEEDQTEPRKILTEIIECARIAKKESILALEARIPNMQDKFLQSVMKAVVDNVEPSVMRDVFNKQIDLEEEKLLNAAKIWTEAGGYAPTIGIIGAVLGLIHVMGNLSDTSKLGAGIAVAFVATVYGVGSANLIFLPIGSKLKKRVADEIKVKEMILEGGLGIQAGMSPSLIDLKLKAFFEKQR
ncbi:MAG: chemotaxis protein MotA [Oligoflexia bacterium]|nr:MAG: chemotaxis protein MotA [Oligoflexia bacterium]